MTINTSVALFQAIGIPGNFIVDQVGAMVLEIDAF